MSNKQYFKPHFLRIHDTVGESGSNHCDDVVWFQTMLNESGYKEVTGRRVNVDGKCGIDTVDGIRWYQNMLSMKPTGMIHPGDVWLQEAISNVVLQPWRKKIGPVQLTVPEGQVTFDAEGNDYIFPDYAPKKAPKNPDYFSRILHWPGDVSGVTIGRGYDMKLRTAGEIFTTLRRLGIEEYRAVLASNAAYLSGRQAKLFVDTTWKIFGEISYFQQIELFKVSYLEKKNYAKHFYVKRARDYPHAPSWEQLELRIRDVVVDIFFQGIRHPASLIDAAIEGRVSLISFIRGNAALMRYESSRHRIRYLQ